MYFSYFKQGAYDIKNDGNDKLLTDLFTRIKIRDKAFNTAALYDKYDVPSGERPEDTAFKHFGHSQYHWVILLTNNITDRYYGWPLSFQEFEQFVNDKYDNADAIHHYEKLQSSGRTTGQGPADYSHLIECQSTDVGAQAISNREYEDRIQDEIRQIKLLNPAYLQIFIEEFEKLAGE
mgnify:CR=1 FL=1|tara:strand:- start:223 stop:756 length:534 start_codon:yes stop_codon:yes gene_type:complete